MRSLQYSQSTPIKGPAINLHELLEHSRSNPSPALTGVQCIDSGAVSWYVAVVTTVRLVAVFHPWGHTRWGGLTTLLNAVVELGL